MEFLLSCVRFFNWIFIELLLVFYC